MLAPFNIKDRDGEVFKVVFIRHKGLCWRMIILTQKEVFVGDLLFEPVDSDQIKILDFHILPKFWRKGVGTEVINSLCASLKTQGFRSIVGVCKSHSRGLSELENLAKWYLRLGFILKRGGDESNPGYIGMLYKDL